MSDSEESEMPSLNGNKAPPVLRSGTDLSPNTGCDEVG